ncbi:OmpA family protein [Marinicella litoralis]|uniref:Outer membrane protein OmpA-like peptidoglycan-associated protein n=2 Tax=Marinicella litoralis TaxID=644220 RepID=A0A4R6XW87_9GAMM|nr:OmpA family protein [Marinicella litoralis]TDR22504.1 outer membrane protein OmpA-like peptidoglycan-associated protein [Marinicella litoralis]
MMKKLSIFILSLLVLQACTTADPYTGEDKVRKSVKYGAAGAIVCGLIGATKNSKNARNAAAGCAAIGAGIGAYMDHQEAELRRELQGSGVQVVRQGDQIQLIMPSNITFNTAEFNIKSSFYPSLNSVAKVLYKYKDTVLDVIGHTDSVGNDQDNRELSNKRAYSVADYLAAQGVPGERLSPLGLGETQPIADNNTEYGRSQNRRVELYITAVQ